MSISFASAIGNLFNRLGKLGALVKNQQAYLAQQLPAMTDTTMGVVAQYNNESDIQAIMGDNYLSILNGAESVNSTVQNIAAATANRMVFRDNPQFGQTLTQGNTLTSLLEIIRQMKVAGATVLNMTVGGSATKFTGVGNGVINTSVNRPLDGLVLENTFAETILLFCTSDSYSGNARAGNESFQIQGDGSQQDVFAFNWPLGSNAKINLTAIDANSNNTAGNLLTNSSYETFGSNGLPANFTVDLGAAGTNLNQETTLTFGNASALRVTGDAGGTLTQLRQQFGAGSTTGTSGTLSPQTQYSFNVFLRRDGIPAGAGIMTVELVDQNGIVINDQNNVPNSFTIDLTGLTTIYTGYKGVFRTPQIMPSQQFLRWRLSTAYTNGRSFYMDKMSLGIMSQFYTSGPFLALHSGSIPFAAGDYANATFTNSRGAGGTLSSWQTLFFQLFTSLVQGNELLLPSSNVPTIGDGLIV